METTERSRKHIHAMMDQSNKKEYIHNDYELPSIEQTVRYLHAAAGHPVEETWLKAIRRGNYNSWPLIDTKTVRKYFPESEETQPTRAHERATPECTINKTKDPDQLQHRAQY